MLKLPQHSQNIEAISVTTHVATSMTVIVHSKQ